MEELLLQYFYLLEGVQRIFIHLDEWSRGRYFDPRSLVEGSLHLKLEFDIWMQNDVSEFAIKLLDRLKLPLKRWFPIIEANIIVLHTSYFRYEWHFERMSWRKYTNIIKVKREKGKEGKRITKVWIPIGVEVREEEVVEINNIINNRNSNKETNTFDLFSLYLFVSHRY